MISVTLSLLAGLMLITTTLRAEKNQVRPVSWTVAGELPASPGQLKEIGFAGSVTGIHHGKMIVGGGANFPDGMPWLGGKKRYYDDVFLFNRKGKKTALYKKSFKLPGEIAYAASCSTPMGVVYAGGEMSEGISSKAWLLQWDKKAATLVILKLPDLPLPLTNAAMTAKENIVYLAGGETTTGVSDLFFCLDLKNPSLGWKSLPPLPKPVSHTLLLVQKNGDHACIYAVGGRKKNPSGISDLYASVLEYDLAHQKWNEKKPLPYPLSAGTGVAAGSNYLLLFGGDRGETFHKTEVLIAAIDREQDEARKAELIRQKASLQSSHPGFSRDMLLYNTLTNEWTRAGTMPLAVPVTTTAVKWDGVVLIPGGEIRAGVRTPKILLGKLSLK